MNLFQSTDEMDLVVGVVEVDLISLWGIELGMFKCMYRIDSGTIDSGFVRLVKIDLVFVMGPELP